LTVEESQGSVQNIDFVSKWVLSPNPLTNSQDINLAFAAEKAFQGNISFFSLSGQALGQPQQYNFKAGQNRVSIPVPSLQNGVYLLALNTNEGVRTERILVSR
ncbi:MAG: T9SS type A sorting domain-containing protein, partial [Cyanothece sp. SIO1E1]|nr:T9SS type A sorting domain-containing protein [Cyanothece sp. SIO1E1]